MKDLSVIYLQQEETDTRRTWNVNKVYDTDILYIKVAIVESEIRCIHNDMAGFSKSIFAVSLDGAKRLKKLLRKTQ